MIASQIRTHTTDAQSRLLQALQNRPVINGIIKCLVDEIQALENAMYPLNAGRALVGGTASGAQLDGIGQLVGLARSGADDTEYRVLLLGTIAQNNSRADNETLLRIAELIFSATSAYIIQPESPGHSQHRGAASLGLEVGSPQAPANLYDLIISIFKKSMAANVALSWVVICDATQGFALDGDNDGLGLGDIHDPSVGGMLASLYFSNPAV